MTAKEGETLTRGEGSARLWGEVSELAKREAQLRERASALESDRASEAELLAGLPEGSTERGFSQFIVDDLSRRVADLEEEADAVRRRLLSASASLSGADLLFLEAALCPRCGRAFAIREIEGIFLDRRCPVCGGKVDEEAYDMLAGEAVGELADETDSVRRAELEARLSALAASRYLAGEFFLLSGTPATGSVRAWGEDEPYSFVPRYGGGRGFALEAREGYHLVGGIEGELVVFDCLRRAVSREGSPLFGGKLVPGVSLPWGMSRRGLEAGRTSQIDCVLLLPHCAFVVEAKRWRGRITVSHEDMRIDVFRRGANERYDIERPPLLQGIEHAAALAKASPHLNTNWIGKVTVFVDPVSFKSDAKRFPEEHSTFVGVCWSKGSSFVQAMEGRANKWATRKVRLGEDELGAFAESLLGRYAQRSLPVRPRFR